MPFANLFLSEATWSVDQKAARLAVLDDSTKAFYARQMAEETTHAHEGVSIFFRQDTEVNDLRKFLLATEAKEMNIVNEMIKVLSISNAAFLFRENFQAEKDVSRDAAYKKENEGVTASLHVAPGVVHRQLQDAPDDGNSTAGYSSDASIESASGGG